MTAGKRARLLLAIGLAAVVVAAVVIAAIGPRSSDGPRAVAPRPAPGVAKTWVPAYMSNDLHYTAAEAVQLARGADLVAGVAASFRPYAAMMRTANPDLTLLAYENATFITPGAAGQ